MSCPRLFEPVDAQHLEGCAECRAVQAAFAAPAPAGEADLEKLKGPALAALEASPRALSWWVWALGFTAATALAAGLGLMLLPPQTPQHASLMLRYASSAAWAATMLAGCFVAVMPGPKALRTALLAAAAACFALTLLAASGHDAGKGVGCALIETAVSLLPLAVGLMVLTGFAFDVTRALAAGVGAMSAGMLAMHLHCPDGTLAHQVTFHLLPVAVLALGATLLRSRLPSRTHAP